MRHFGAEVRLCDYPSVWLTNVTLGYVVQVNFAFFASSVLRVLLCSMVKAKL